MTTREAPIKKVIQKIQPKQETLEWCSMFVQDDDIVWCDAMWNNEDSIWEPSGDPFVLTEKEMMSPLVKVYAQKKLIMLRNMLNLKISNGP